jgi:pimeloyl-ACP methyl ester carboxylesterase
LGPNDTSVGVSRFDSLLRRTSTPRLRATATHDTSARLGQITAPTTIVHGDQDLMLDVSNAHQIAGLMPHARLEILEGAGHVFWIEQPERSAQLVVETARAR